jgi:hypothetical protein
MGKKPAIIIMLGFWCVCLLSFQNFGPAHVRAHRVRNVELSKEKKAEKEVGSKNLNQNK